MTTISVGKNYNIQILRGLDTNRSLLSTVQGGPKVDLFSTDDLSGRQQWNIVPVEGLPDVYNIILNPAGIKSTRAYLSCSDNGQIVDLWGVDDGSGRQRWQFIPVLRSGDNSGVAIPQYFNIKVFAGVNIPGGFLSCSPDGLNVALVSADDKSGRQRWQLQ